jgi:O-methyltransferase
MTNPIRQLAENSKTLRSLRDAAARQERRIVDLAGATDRGLGQVERIQQTLVRRVAKLEQLVAERTGYGEDEYFTVVGPVLDDGRTLLGHDRLFTLWQATRNAARLAGDDVAAAEIGTYRGGAAYVIGAGLRHHAGRPFELHVHDTFEGHPGHQLGEHDPGQVAGKFSDTSEDDVRAYLTQRLQGIHLHRGDAAVTVNALPDRRWALVHLDVDLYDPTLACLRYFGPRMAAGGVIVLDDFGAPSCPGIERAYKQFASESGQPLHAWSFSTEQLVLVSL